MKTFSERLPLEDIDKGDGDAFAQHVLSVWRKSEGNLVEDYITAFPNMVLFDGAPKVNDTPDLLECGDEALSVKLLGEGWAENKKETRDFLGKDYCVVVGRDYFDATTLQMPMYSIVQALMQNTSGEILKVRYQRLILPVRTMGGRPFLFGYSFDRQREGLARGHVSDCAVPLRRRLEETSYANLFR